MNLLKKIIFFCFAVLFFENIAQAQCPQGDVVLETQAQVDSFAILYPNCMEIAGNLEIGGGGIWAESNDIADLSPLNQITSIENTLYFSRTSLENLSGLENVTFIGRDLYVYANDYLLSLSGLESLTSIGNDFYLDTNSSLSDLGDFKNLTSIGSDLDIKYHSNLITLSGLKNLSSIGAYTEIYNNNNLINLSGLENVASIGSDLTIGRNNNLASIVGFANLTSIGGDLRIARNENLINMTSLSSLTSINGELQISNNDNLASLTGLQNISYNTITNLEILSNPMLFVCNFESICNYLESGNTSYIYDNTTDCNSSEEVLALCPVSTTTPDDQFITILPNPNIGIFTVQDIPKGTYQIHNTSGQMIRQGEMKNDISLDISTEAQGVYFISVTIDKETSVKRIVKM